MNKQRFNIYLDGVLIGTQVSTSELRARQVFASRKRLNPFHLTASVA